MAGKSMDNRELVDFTGFNVERFAGVARLTECRISLSFSSNTAEQTREPVG